MVTRHDHIEVLVDCVAGVWLGWVSTTGKDVGVLHERNHIWCMSATSSFDMVCVYCPSLECSCRPLNETGLVQRVAVDLALDVVFFADTITVISIRNDRASKIPLP